MIIVEKPVRLPEQMTFGEVPLAATFRVYGGTKIYVKCQKEDKAPLALELDTGILREWKTKLSCVIVLGEFIER